MKETNEEINSQVTSYLGFTVSSEIRSFRLSVLTIQSTALLRDGCFMTATISLVVTPRTSNGLRNKRSLFLHLFPRIKETLPGRLLADSGQAWQHHLTIIGKLKEIATVGFDQLVKVE